MLTTFVALLSLAAPTPPRPATLSPAQADSVRRAIEKDRDDTRTWLKSSPTSYLAAVARTDFSTDRLTVGRDPASNVRLDDPSVRPRHVEVTVVGDSFHVRAIDDSATFKLKGANTRNATVGPTSIQVGRYTLRLSHQRFPAIIVFDPESPHYKLYKGIEYFPVDLAWRYVLELTPNPHPDTTVIVSTRGSQRRAVRAGWFDFVAGGQRCRLEAHRLLEPGVGEHDLRGLQVPGLGVRDGREDPGQALERERAGEASAGAEDLARGRRTEAGRARACGAAPGDSTTETICSGTFSAAASPVTINCA